jgi:hypothetical protein
MCWQPLRKRNVKINKHFMDKPVVCAYMLVSISDDQMVVRYKFSRHKKPETSNIITSHEVVFSYQYLSQRGVLPRQQPPSSDYLRAAPSPDLSIFSNGKKPLTNECYCIVMKKSQVAPCMQDYSTPCPGAERGKMQATTQIPHLVDL